jgi:hypothetical protein
MASSRGLGTSINWVVLTPIITVPSSETPGCNQATHEHALLGGGAIELGCSPIQVAEGAGHPHSGEQRASSTARSRTASLRMRSLDPRKWLMDVMCIALIVFICVGVVAAFFVMAIMNQALLLTRNLNPFSREAAIQ